jgi:two-component system cell cycle sensor histidine kinase/response regulator CckA
MANSSTGPTENIIVVDDAPEVLAVAEDMLRTMGYAVISTADPHAALRLARRPGSIHLLLTDVVISLMSGCQLAQEFRKVRPEA